jgi:GNAT superfamily N-acetyltransferase
LPGRVQASLQRRLATARETYRTGGATGVILKVLLKLGYHRVILYEELLHPEPPPFAARVPVEYEFLDRSSMDEIAAFRSDVPREQLEQRFDRGERCFAARFEGRIACAFWMQTHDVQFPELGYALVVPPGAYHVGDGYTAPDMRGQRISPALIRELKIRLAAEGVERWVAYVLGGNVLGLINAKHIGSRETGRVAALKLGPLPPVRVPYFPRRKSE